MTIAQMSGIELAFESGNRYAKSEASQELLNTYLEIQSDFSLTATHSNYHNEVTNNVISVFMDEINETDNVEAQFNLVQKLLIALNFIKLIPQYFPHPDIYVDDDNEFCFDWIKGKSNYLSVAISHENYCTFANISGSDKLNGQVSYFDQLPKEIWNIIINNFI